MFFDNKNLLILRLIALLSANRNFEIISCTVVQYVVQYVIISFSGVDPDSFVIGSVCRRHEISRGVHGHGPGKFWNLDSLKCHFLGFEGNFGSVKLVIPAFQTSKIQYSIWCRKTECYVSLTFIANIKNTVQYMMQKNI